MSDFSDRPFVAGSLTGLRAFEVDRLGRLTGVSFAEVFTPGENVATCGGRINSLEARMHSQMTLAFQSIYSVGGSGHLSRSPETQQHVVAGVDCKCGYYAYFDGSNRYLEDGRIAAVVEGYGVCTVGQLGFRAEKARLVALIGPRVTRTHSARFDRLADWMRAHSGFDAVLSAVPGLVGLVGTIAGIGLSVDVSPWFAVVSVLGLALVALAVVLGRASFHGISRSYPSVSDVSKCPDHQPDSARFDLVRRNYPDVPVYASVEDALRAHPVTPPPAPVVSPETCDDFWTRADS